LDESTVAGFSIYTERTQTRRSGTASTSGLTTGGRKPKKQSKKKRLKIKQGSPEEEAALIAHLSEMRLEESTLHEVSSLNEFLLFLGYIEDARRLQSTADRLIKSHQKAMQDFSQAGHDCAVKARWKWDILRN